MPTDLLALARERAQTNLFWRYLDVQVDDAGEGWVKLRVPVHDPLRNAAGAPVHGGVLSALVDMAVGGALSPTNKKPARRAPPTPPHLHLPPPPPPPHP